MNPLLRSITGAPKHASQASATNEEASAYLRRYPDVAADRNFARDPMSHFRRFGTVENRRWGEDPVNASSELTASQATAMGVPAYASLDGMYGNDDGSWDTYKRLAQAQSAGMNRMPHVFSNFGEIPNDPATVNALFYEGPRNAGVTNPLLSGYPRR